VKFGPVAIADAEGAILAHAVRGAEAAVRKGVTLTRADILALEAAGVREVVVAQLEDGDVAEDDAARTLADVIAGPRTHCEAPFTGRVNLFAREAGILRIDRAKVDRVNDLDEAVTVATLPDLKPVVAGEMIATVKIIPFAVPQALVHAAMTAGPEAIAITPYRLKRVAVISTLLPALKASVVEKTVKVLSERLQPTGAELSQDLRVEHGIDALALTLRDAMSATPDLIVVFGASAVSDRRDVVPAAIISIGGVVEHLGMPVDPGNLLLLGRIGDTPVIGAPGCARSPRENGFDWVLARLLAGVPVTGRDIQAMGVGGLLMEIVSRPQPRAPIPLPQASGVAAIVLAAGRSTRMGPDNKLLAMIGDKPMVRHVVEAALASKASPVIVVTGHEADHVRAALAGLEVTFQHNPEFALGLSGSVRRGLSAAPADAKAGLILLGDMPKVTPAILNRLIAVHGEEPTAAAVAPVAGGRRGNPVLITRQLFQAMDSVSGDTGARALLDAAGAAVAEVAVSEDGVLLDIDTPEALNALKRTLPE
jgi:molybdenum cofactor cytidylyltransferase